MPNTSAEAQGLQRGDVFYTINGTLLNSSNFFDIYNSTTYTLGFGSYDNNGTPKTEDDHIIPGLKAVTLTKAAYTENPILESEVIPVDGINVGYLMYNFFNRDFDEQLNDAFGTFASQIFTNWF